MGGFFSLITNWKQHGSSTLNETLPFMTPKSIIIEAPRLQSFIIRPEI
jgi:hypothetical protein